MRFPAMVNDRVSIASLFHLNWQCQTGNLAAWQYTAIVSGKNGGIGIGLVEVYRLPDF